MKRRIRTWWREIEEKRRMKNHLLKTKTSKSESNAEQNAQLQNRSYRFNDIAEERRNFKPALSTMIRATTKLINLGKQLRQNHRLSAIWDRGRTDSDAVMWSEENATRFCTNRQFGNISRSPKQLLPSQWQPDPLSFTNTDEIALTLAIDKDFFKLANKKTQGIQNEAGDPFMPICIRL